MKRALTLVLLAIILGAAALPALADAHAPRIEGKQARKERRNRIYWNSLTGDKKCVYREHGHTPNRLRVDHGFGEITETWTYHDLGLEFTFDSESELTERRSIPVEQRAVEYF